MAQSPHPGAAGGLRVTFSNPAGDAKANASAYVRSLYEVLGRRDPLEVYAELVPAVESLIADLDEATLRRPERPGKWAIVEVVQHLADTEIVYGYRMRMTLTHPAANLQGYDQDAWARELRYIDVPVEQAMSQLRILRAANLRMLRGLTDEQLDRTGQHDERGPESVRTMMEMIAAHDLVHRKQIQRIRAALGVGEAFQAS